MAWPTDYAPVSNNTAPLLVGLSSATTGYGDAVSVPVAVDPNTGELQVSGTVTADQGGTWSVGVSSLPSIPAGTNTIGAISNTSFTATQTSGANLHVDIDNFPSTQAVSLTSTTITGTVAVTESGTWNVGLNSGTNNIGNVGTVLGGVNVGQLTVSTTPVQLSSISTVPTNGIIVGALSTNSASIFIGDSAVSTTTGAEIMPGAMLSFTCNLDSLYIISASSTTDKIWYNVV